MPADVLAASGEEAGAGDAAFKEQEATVLSWLVERADVGEAVDWALSGQEEEALELLGQALRAVLAEVEEKEAAAAEAAAAPQPEEETATAAGQPPAKKPRRGPARSVCIVLAGFRGSGKSTLCHVLRETLGGAWLHFDEFVSKHPERSEKYVRQVFGGELRGCITKSLAFSERDKNMRLVLVDRDTCLRNQRVETLLEMRKLHYRKRGGKVILVELVHTADTFGYGADGQLSKRVGEQHLSLCARRIEERGGAHHALWPSPKLRQQLAKAAREAEEVKAEEYALYDGRVTVDLTLPVPEAANLVLDELRALGWLEGLRSRDELEPKVRIAWQAYARAEGQWRAGVAASAGAPAEHEEWLKQCRAVKEAERARERTARREEEQAAAAAAAEEEKPAAAEEEAPAEEEAAAAAEPEEAPAEAPEAAAQEAAEPVAEPPAAEPEEAPAAPEAPVAAEPAVEEEPVREEEVPLEMMPRLALSAKQPPPQPPPALVQPLVQPAPEAPPHWEAPPSQELPEEAPSEAPAPSEVAMSEMMEECEMIVAAPSVVSAPAAAQEEEDEVTVVEEEQAGEERLEWRLHLPEVKKVLAQTGILPAPLRPVSRPHVCLLPVEGGSAEQRARNAGLDTQDFEMRREALEALQGEEFEVRMKRFIVDDRAACAVVVLPSLLPSTSATPHVVLAVRNGVPHEAAAEMLASVEAGTGAVSRCFELPNPRPLKGKLLLEPSDYV